MKIVYKVLAVTLSVIVGLLIAEGIVRFQGNYYVWSELNGYGWVYSNSFKNPYYWVHNSGEYSHDTPDFNYEVAINNLGIRDSNHALNKPDSTIRIVSLGDSFTEGFGVPFDSTWLNQLTDKLQQNCNVKIEPIVGGVSSSDLFYAYVLLRDKLLPYQPDYVVLCLNDTDFGDYVERGGFERFERDSLYKKPMPAIEPFFAHSHLFRMIIMEFFGYGFELRSPKQQQEDWQAYSEQFNIALDKYVALSDSAGFQFVMVFHPVPWEGALGAYWHDMDEFMKLAEAKGIPYVNTMDSVYAKTDSGQNTDKVYWPIDNHFNRHGYEILADGLQPVLSEFMASDCN